MNAVTTPQHPDGKIENQKEAAEALQASRGAHAEQLAQDQTQVPRRHLDQVAFFDFQHATQPGATGASRFAEMREGPFDKLAASSLQPLAPRATHTAAIGVRRFL